MAQTSRHSLLIRQLAIATAVIWLTCFLYVHSATRETGGFFNAKVALVEETNMLLNELARTPASEPLSQADLERRLGLTYFSFKRYKEAEPHFRKWLELSRKYATSTARVTLALSTTANFYRDWRHYEEAAHLYRDAEDLDNRASGTDPAPLIRDWNNLGVLEFLVGAATAAEDRRQEHFKKSAQWFAKAHQLTQTVNRHDSRSASLLKTIERNQTVTDYESRPPVWPG